VAASWWFLTAGACLVPTGFIGGMVLSMFLGAILFRNRFAWTFPADCTTVADLARFLTANGPPQAEEVPWMDRDVRLAARALLAGAVGKRPFDVRPEMRLVEDLGLPFPGVQG
jgi:hypothetical protein